jgi:hypothetical protein
MAALNDEFDGGRGGHVRTGKVRSSDAGCPSDTVTADRLWEALHQARAGRTPQTLAHTPGRRVPVLPADGPDPGQGRGR